MKKIILSLAIVAMALFAQAQSSTSKILTNAEVNTLLTVGTKSLFNISYPIFRVYQYKNNNYKFYLVLTESVDEVKEKDSISKNIKAIVLKEFNGELNKEQEINDNILPSLNDEFSISFWTKYLSFEKVGNTTVPIVVYGTKGMNNYMDGRVKIITIYNSQKIVIRHQNGVLDGERLTQIDKAFYTLPVSIQNAVKKKIAAMEKNEHAILGYGWEEQMKKMKLEIKG
jgi:hypothetical protein